MELVADAVNEAEKALEAQFDDADAERAALDAEVEALLEESADVAVVGDAVASAGPPLREARVNLAPLPPRSPEVVDEPQIGRTEDPDRVLVRLTHRVTCGPEEGSDAATHLQLSHVVALDVVSELTTRWPVVAAWIETNLYFLVYPYVRQTVSTLTTSLGMPSIVLNYLDRDARPLTQQTSQAAHG